MNKPVVSIVTTILFILWMLVQSVVPSWAARHQTIKLGYLEHAGSVLCLIAADKGYFRKEGVTVKLVGFTDARSGLAALTAGTIDAGAFTVAETLNFIAAGTGIRIIAGGGAVFDNNPVSELDENGMEESYRQGIVVSIPKQGPPKAAITQLTAGLIHAYRAVRQYPRLGSRYAGRAAGVVVFNPNPDYYRLERIWKSLGLQAADMKPDFLANHVYEEIYCDALDRLMDSASDDPIFKELSSKAVCTPDCCPKTKNK